jgi:non-ribosomal peptide synthetase component F
MTLLAAFNVLLRYLSKQDDIVVGTNVANRNRSETEGVIGFFVNTVVLRSDLSGNPSFVELLRRVREACLGAYAHQDVPFEKVVEVLRPERDLSRQPLFQVKMDLDNELIGALELKGLTLNRIELSNEVGRYDLQLFITETKEGLLGSIAYDKNLFDESTAVRISGQLEVLLQKVMKQPQTSLRELEEMLVEGDRRQQAVQETDYKNSIRRKLKQAGQKTATETL